MADNKDIRDGRDRSKVSGSEEYELRHLSEKLNVPIERIRRAIEVVGNDRAKIEAYVNDPANRG